MPAKKPIAKTKVKHVLYISDTHAGCGLAICPDVVHLDDGGEYHPSKLQKKIKSYWDELFGEWLPEKTNGEPWACVHNGDAIDGVHHQSVTQITNNLSVQGDIAYDLLKPVVDACEGRYYHIRGTEAHVGRSAQEEERLAKRLGAIPNEDGQHARYDLWLRLGKSLIHSLHHIGTTGSQAYESTAVMKELTEHFIEAARWMSEIPVVIVRSHRHRCIKLTIPICDTIAQAVVTPCWQGKGPYAFRIPGARLSTPQFGAVLVSESGHEHMIVREKVWTIERSKEVVI